MKVKPGGAHKAYTRVMESMGSFIGAEALALLSQGSEILLLPNRKLPRCTDKSASLQMTQLALPAPLNFSCRYSKDRVFLSQGWVKLKQGINLGELSSLTLFFFFFID